MKTQIAPTITAENPHTYREQIERVAAFARRIHVDFADGDFAPTRMVPPVQAWLPEGVHCDLHVMYRHPERELDQLMSLRPQLIILHAEAEGNLLALLRQIKGAGIQAGVALLQNSQPEEYANEIEEAEHALIFGGHLGYHGGDAALSMLGKIERIKAFNPLIEIGWDGGANDTNAGRLAHVGVDVINVGSFVQKADDPQSAYATMESVVE